MYSLTLFSFSLNKKQMDFSFSFSFFIHLLTSTLLILPTHSTTPTTLTVFNNCPYTIWPAIQPNTGSDLLQQGGFQLGTLTYRSFPAPSSPWSGRIWARTYCSFSNTKFTCVTGDCGTSLIECNGSSGSPPATLAQFSLPGITDTNNVPSSYSVSVVDGFNIPMTITPHEGSGKCPVVGCAKDLLGTCPECLKMRCGGDGQVVGCKSGCETYRSDELCCKGHYENPEKCKANSYSQWFKEACPATFTYAFDSRPEIFHECYDPHELKVIFCP